MDAFAAIFSHVCGQARPLVLDGGPLPLCQRCLGLYAGAAVTALWLLASGVWRRGLPDRPVTLSNVLVLLAALVGGVHLLDAGPAWRLACGLWTGHVAMLWLVGGAEHLRRAARGEANPVPPWPLRDQVQGLLAAPLLAAVAVAEAVPAGRLVWTGLALAGAAGLAAALAAALHAAAGYTLALVRRRRTPWTPAGAGPPP